MVTANQPGKTYLMQGNEAFVRGALEAGVRFAAAYPGSPGSEIMATLGRVAEKRQLYAEWSTNEICAFQACMGASMSGVRALCVAKQNGLLVIGDALHSAALSGCKGGVVVIVADDPDAHSSTNEFDSRHQARSANIPLLEPANFQEAKDMMKYAFELSEELQQVVMIRGVTRIHHGRGNVTLGELPENLRDPQTPKAKLLALNNFHGLLLQKLNQAREKFEESVYNWYVGPENPELIIAACGTGWFYSQEAVEILNLSEKVGILKIGCTWPLPEKFVVQHLAQTSRILVVEEVDPFLEQNLCTIIANHPELTLEVLGRYQSKAFSLTNEMNTDRVTDALGRILGKTKAAVPVPAENMVNIPPRDLSFCAGCPHRASYYSIKQALSFLGGGLVMADIGCYTIGAMGSPGFNVVSGLSCMGGGINMAEGLGQLSRFGFDQPVIALAGDSTFFHTCLPGLVSSRYHDANMLFIVLDNSATAMTGFQPHPGIGITCMGEAATAISIEKVATAIGCSVTVADPYKIEETTQVIYDLLQQPGMKVLVLRQKCATLATKNSSRRRVYVDPDLCRGEECGCNRYCSRVWGCPGNIWDYETGRAKIDEVVCVGCGVCASLCPAGAIKIEEGNDNDSQPS